MEKIIKQFWTKEHIDIVEGKLTHEEWSELVERLDHGSFYDELSNLALDFIKEELKLMREDN
jgi:hypothetical protein